MTIFLRTVLILTAFSLEGCFLNASLSKTDASAASDPVSSSPAKHALSLAFSPDSAPEGFPYYGAVTLSGSGNSILFSLVNSTCDGLAINSTTGVMEGRLNFLSSESCQFQVQAIVDGSEVVSEVKPITFAPEISISLNSYSFSFLKGSPSQSLVLNLSSPAPYKASLDYEIKSSSGVPDLLSGLTSSGGKIEVPAGATQVSVSLEWPSSSPYSGTDFQILRIHSGRDQKRTDVSLSFLPTPPASASYLSAASYATCSIVSGKLYCWGDNQSGQLGDGLGTYLPKFAPNQIGTATGWTAVSTNASSTCGIESGNLYCWGLQSSGLVGNGNFTNSIVDSPVLIGSSSAWTKISVGYSHACGIDGGALYCWGSDGNGALGGDPVSGSYSAVPFQVGASTTWTDISAGTFGTCGIDAGKLYCWGKNHKGQVGNASSGIDVTVPVQVGVSTNWTSVVTSFYVSCGTNSGELYCWGDDTSQMVGNGDSTTTMVTSPFQVGTSNMWSSVSIGMFAVCGIKDSQLFCWGTNSYRQLGNSYDDGKYTGTPQQVGNSSSWQVVQVASRHACGIDNSKVFCWGNSLNGAAGLGTTGRLEFQTAPMLFGSDTNWDFVSSGAVSFGSTEGSGMTCGIRAGKLYCWGGNTNGRLGYFTGSHSENFPVQVGSSNTWTHVSVGSKHTCGISSGKLYCWGSNSSGQLGLSSNLSLSFNYPQRVGTLENWTDIASEYTHTCGVESGRLFCWGDESYQQLGNGAAGSDYFSTSQIGSSTTWTDVEVSTYVSCGIDSGELYCWGFNWKGQFGDGTQYNTADSPYRVGSSSGWTKLSLSTIHLCGIDTGKLYCWGSGLSGGLGIGSNPTAQKTPAQVGSDSTWTDVSVMGSTAGASCGINAGALYCWGINSYGVLGTGNLSTNGYSVNTPQQVGSLTTWTKISLAHDSHACGIESGKVRCWGNNLSGQVSPLYLSGYSPTAVTGF